MVIVRLLQNDCFSFYLVHFEHENVIDCCKIDYKPIEHGIFHMLKSTIILKKKVHNLVQDRVSYSLLYHEYMIGELICLIH